ncbi:MAG: alpha/beta fold hydrolase [Synechococcus sp.]
MRLWCIHGNLQTPNVWQQIGDRWWESVWSGQVKLECVDLWAEKTADFQYADLQHTELQHIELQHTELQHTELQHWAQEFCRRVQSHALTGESQWLLGYSLGGRLAFHALLNSPEVWAGGIAIAADPGIKSGPENQRVREQCLHRDREWGQRFLREPWDRLLQDWDRQAVFAGYKCGIERLETAFDRHRIAQLFDSFSKGRQADLWPALAQLDRPPILYISGQDDLKYSTIGAELAECCSTVTHASVPAAGHRVPWENSAGFVRAIAQFVRSQPQSG